MNTTAVYLKENQELTDVIEIKSYICYQNEITVMKKVLLVFINVRNVCM